MLLSEMLRKISQEMVIYSGAGGSVSTTTDYVDVRTVTFTLQNPAIVWFTFDTKCYISSSTEKSRGNGRLLVDDVPIISSGDFESGTSTTTITRSGYLFLQAGTHTFRFQVSAYYLNGTYASVGIDNINVKAFLFPDVKFDIVQSGTVNVGINATATVLTGTIQIPKRKVCIGELKQMVLLIVFHLYSPDGRYGVLKNPNEGNTSGKLNWRLLINGVGGYWSDRRGDYETTDTSNQTYAIGAYGFYRKLVNAGDTLTFEVRVTNSTTTPKNCRANVSFFACPWFLPEESGLGISEYEPVSLNFPVGSTLYVVLEPLSIDVNKSIKLGHPRAWSLGYDYYSTASGYGILTWNYTFENIPPTECLLKIGGRGGCISIIAVDVR